MQGDSIILQDLRRLKQGCPAWWLPWATQEEGQLSWATPAMHSTHDRMELVVF